MFSYTIFCVLSSSEERERERKREREREREREGGGERELIALLFCLPGALLLLYGFLR